MPITDITEHHIDVSGGTVYARRWTPAGAGDKSPVILLHNSLGCVAAWRDFPAMLAEKLSRPVIAYDRLGFGRSSPRHELPSLHFVRQEAQDYLPALLQALSIDNFILWGHSVGGGMSVAGAAYFGNRCEAVITEAAQAFVEDKTRAGIRAAQLNFQAPAVFEKLARYHGDKTPWVLHAWFDIWLADEFSDWSLKDDLPRVISPMLILYGDDDEFGSLKFPEMMQALSGGPTSMAILQDCGHNPHREQTDTVLNAAESFLNLRG